MKCLNRILMGGVTGPQARVRAAMTASAVAGAVIHPVVVELDDESLRLLLLNQVCGLFPAGEFRRYWCADNHR